MSRPPQASPVPPGHAPGPSSRPAWPRPQATPPAVALAQFLQLLSLRPDWANSPPYSRSDLARLNLWVGGLRAGPSGHRPLRLTAAVTHRPLPKAQGRCLPTSRGPARPSPALREQDGETSTSEGRAGPDELQRRREVPVSPTRGQAHGPARPAQTELREAGGGGEPHVTGRHSGGSS